VYQQEPEEFLITLQHAGSHLSCQTSQHTCGG